MIQSPELSFFPCLTFAGLGGLPPEKDRRASRALPSGRLFELSVGAVGASTAMSSGIELAESG